MCSCGKINPGDHRYCGGCGSSPSTSGQPAPSPIQPAEQRGKINKLIRIAFALVAGFVLLAVFTVVIVSHSVTPVPRDVSPSATTASAPLDAALPSMPSINGEERQRLVRERQDDEGVISSINSILATTSLAEKVEIECRDEAGFEETLFQGHVSMSQCRAGYFSGANPFPSDQLLREKLIGWQNKVAELDLKLGYSRVAAESHPAAARWPNVSIFGFKGGESAEDVRLHAVALGMTTAFEDCRPKADTETDTNCVFTSSHGEMLEITLFHGELRRIDYTVGSYDELLRMLEKGWGASRTVTDPQYSSSVHEEWGNHDKNFIIELWRTSDHQGNFDGGGVARIIFAPPRG